ncbi:MAG: PAS domain S-box protein [Chloroflexi bacterium]|nr:PAS domain S-box protein [Chloroflexota bacterium]
MRTIFKPPVFGNDEDNHQAYLLNVILWGLVVIPIPYVLYYLIFAPEGMTRALIQSAAGETINVILLVLLRRRFVRAASYIQVSSFWLFLTVSAFTGKGIHDESYLLGYPLVIVIAGLLLGGRVAFVTAGLSLLSGLLMVRAETSGWIVPSLRPPLETWTVSLIVFPMGAILQYLSTRTVTRALDRARLSEERYRLISNVSFDYTFETSVDKDGGTSLVWVGGAFEKMTGYTMEEYIATGGWLGHVHPDDLEKDAADMAKLHRNQEVINSEIRTFTKSGEIRWERIFAFPVWNSEENRLASIVGAVQDVTAQKQAEERVMETMLQQAAILNNIPDMAWLKDLESRYIAVNEQFLKTSGRRLEEVLGRTDYDIWSKTYADRYRQDDLEVVRSGRRRQVEELQADSTGREYWVETIKTPIRNAQDEIIGTTGIAREITERKKAEMERERLIAELETKNAELERFTYTVSHDLKAPLVTINGFLSYLERDARSGNFDKFNNDLMRIHQAVDKMQILLKDLLELSRIGRIINEPEETDFGGIVREALALTEGQIHARGVRIEFVEDGHKIFGDRTRLVEVLQNLIDNAAKFMGDQPDPRICIGTVTNAEGEPVFYVQDNGIGIAPQYSERIFGLFNKLDSHSQGSGVGLTLVKRIVEIHGGRVWVDSQPGKGSTFYFTVPHPATG